MTRTGRRAALAALLAAPVLAIPVWSAPAASAQSPFPVPTARPTPSWSPSAWPTPSWSPSAWPIPSWPTRSCALPGTPLAPSSKGRVERLIGNLSPAPGRTVSPGATISFLLADGGPFPTPLSGDAVVTVNGTTVTAVAGAEESGVPVKFANSRDVLSWWWGWWQPTACEVPFSFTLPETASGTVQIKVTAYDGDGHHETLSWTVKVATTDLPGSTVGGLGVAAVGGVVLTVVQLRRRRGAAR